MRPCALALLLVLLAPGLSAEDERTEDPEVAELSALRDRIEARLTKLAIDEDPLRVGKAPEKTEKTEKAPLPERIEFESSAVAVEVPGVVRKLEYAVPEAAMRQIVGGNLETLAQVRKQIDDDVKAQRVSAAVGEDIDAALQRAAAGARMKRPLLEKKRIQTSVNLQRLKYAVSQSKAGADEGSRQASAALAEEAFELSGAPSRGRVSVPPAIDAPSLRVRPVPALRIKPSRPGATLRPKGVKIAIDEAMLARVLRAQGWKDGIAELVRVEDAVLASASGLDAFRKLQAYTEAKKAEFVRRFMRMRDLGPPRIVSLSALLAKAKGYRNRWSQRPRELRTVGNLTRIFGYLRNAASGDLLLVGRAEAGAPPILLDDLSVGLREVWREGRTPTVSLDPDPNDWAGLHHARVGGVPGDSPFALAMLEADYSMKRILSEAPGCALDIDGFRSLIDMYFEIGTEGPMAARFWLFPVQPTSRSVMLGPGGSSALFEARVQVLTEDAIVSEAGMAFTGKSHPAHTAAARSFSEHYDAIAARRPEFRRLRGLFDIVMLGRVLRLTAPGDATLDALCELPYEAAKVPKGYPGVVVHHERGGRPIDWVGGCDINARARWRTLMESGTETHARLTEAASGTAGLSTDLSVALRVPDDTGEESNLERRFVEAVHMLVEGRHDAADERLSRLIEADPSFANAYALRATVRCTAGRQRAGLWDAAHAVLLAPKDLRIQAIFYRLLFQSGVEDAFDGATPEVRETVGNLYARAGRMILLRNDPMLLRASEKALEYALVAYPNNAEAYATRAELHLKRGDPRAALTDANRALAIEPEHTRALFARAAAHYAEEQFAKAKQDLTTALELNRSDLTLRAACLEARSRASLKLQDFMGAGQDATDALDIMPMFWRPQATRALATYNIARRLPKAAVQRFEKYCAMALTSVENALALGPKDNEEFREQEPDLRSLRDTLRKIVKR